jgi:hypothetical protein
MERELAAIRSFLERIANSLEQLASEPQSAAPVAVAAVPDAVSSAVDQVEASPAAPEGKRVPLPPIREGRETQEPGGHRRLHSLPKVMGQRGKRPE